MDVLMHIKEEHAGFKEKIAEIKTAKGDRKKKIFRELYAEIHGHHEAEEKVVFPIVKEKAEEEAQKVVLEMIEEHSLISYQFSVVEKTSVENKTWDAKFSVLREVLEHHLEEEEEEFLPMARKMIYKEIWVEALDKFETVLEENKKEKEKELD